MTISFLFDKTPKRDRVPRWRWIDDGFSSDSRASRIPIDTSVHCCIFVFFFCISTECPSLFFFFFVKIVAGLATTCSVKENFGYEKVGQLDKKRRGRTSLPMPLLRPGGGAGVGGDGLTQTDGWTVTKDRTMGQKKSN